MKIKNSDLSRSLLFLVIVSSIFFILPASGQDKILIFDTFHGQNASINVPGLNAIIANEFQNLLPAKSAKVRLDSVQINEASLKGAYGLILFGPSKEFKKSEKDAVVDYLRLGGSLLLLFDEEKRMSLSLTGVNDLIKPFGLELTDDIPYHHNCGAIAEKSDVCNERRELPYSGGRSIVGGTVISRVYDEGNYIHCSYTDLPQGGKIIVMSDAMAGLLLGSPEGERFHGTGPLDSKYWGKDSRVFMKEILSFLLKK